MVNQADVIEHVCAKNNISAEEFSCSLIDVLALLISYGHCDVVFDCIERICEEKYIRCLVESMEMWKSITDAVKEQNV